MGLLAAGQRKHAPNLPCTRILLKDVEEFQDCGWRRRPFLFHVASHASDCHIRIGVNEPETQQRKALVPLRDAFTDLEFVEVVLTLWMTMDHRHDRLDVLAIACCQVLSFYPLERVAEVVAFAVRGTALTVNCPR